jgi:hypothetical protein
MKEIILETVPLPMEMKAFCKCLAKLVKKHGKNALVRGTGKTLIVFCHEEEETQEDAQ